MLSFDILVRLEAIEEDTAGKPLTAYNQFMHQEKQYIVGMQLANAQTFMGKHGGDRWTDMAQSERELYQALQDTRADVV